MPDRLNTAEGIDRLSDDIATKVMKLRMSTDKGQANGNSAGSSAGWYVKYAGTINVILGVILSLVLTAAGVAYKTSSDKLDLNGKEIDALQAEMKVLKEDRSLRIGKIDGVLSGIETELRGYRVEQAAFQTMKGTVIDLAKRLDTGRDERLRDRETDRGQQQQTRDAILQAIGDVKTEVALLKQEARGRNPDRAPFGENQMLIVPPPTANPDAPPILKASASRSSRVAARRPARFRQLRGVFAGTFGKPPKMWRSAFGTRMAYR